MVIGICDDEALFREKLKNFLLEYKSERRLNIDIVEFKNGNDLLEYQSNLDVVFLDYQMPNINGLDVAKKLRVEHKMCAIIFVTIYTDFMIDSFEVTPFRFLVKPIYKEKLYLTLDDYIKEKKMFSPIIVNTPDGQVTINSEDIIYIEGDGKYSIIRTNSGTFRTSKILSDVLKLLPAHCFYRTHKSYIINLYCVSLIKDNYVTLTNDEKVIISRNKIVPFKNAYKDFIRYFIRRN